MFPFILYAITASIVLVGYEALQLFFPPHVLDVPGAQVGGIILFVGALLNLWRRRVAAGIALLGAILIWSDWLHVANVGLHTFYLGYGGVGIILLPAVFFIAIFLVPATAHAVVAVSGVNARLKFPNWLFPRDPQPLPVPRFVTRPKGPDVVRIGALLLYSWWGISLIEISISSYPGAYGFGHSDRALDIGLTAVGIWFVLQAERGWNWARFALLAMLVFRLPPFLRTISVVFEYSKRQDALFALLVFGAQAAGVTLLFDKRASVYFAQRPKPRPGAIAQDAKSLFLENQSLRLSDVPAKLPPRPLPVRWALYLLYAGWGVSAISVLFDLHPSAFSINYPFLMFISTVLVVWLWIIIEIANGRNWARIFLLVILLFGVFLRLMSSRQFRFDTPGPFLDIVVTLAQSVAVYLLFTRSSSAYFSQIAKEKQPATAQGSR